MSALTLDRLLTLLREYVRQTGDCLDLLLIGRLALQAYGADNPQTEDLDAEVAGFRVRLLAPTDFVICKLRRGMEQDLDDAAFVAQKFGVSSDAVRAAAEQAIAASPKDTTLFAFRKTVELFCRRLHSGTAAGS